MQIELDQELCKGCTICLEVCPREVFGKAAEVGPRGFLPVTIEHPEDCTRCLLCELLCPDLAITVGEAEHVSPVQGRVEQPGPVEGGWTTIPSALEPGTYLMLGDEACAEGAVAAGCRFYAGYPITPASEVMVHIIRRFREVGGTFVQMEDEIASMGAIIGASWAGTKSMTATSGPGFSLMLENIGYACMTEAPCVIVDVQRAGPSTGQATRPAQGDVMQAKWGTHGGVEIIGLAPWSVHEMYELTIRAFNLSERFRVPVILLADEAVGHLQESFDVDGSVQVFNRIKRAGSAPFGTHEPDGVPPMPTFGEGERLLITGSTHDPRGVRRTTNPLVHETLVRRLSAKILAHQEEIADYEAYFADDARRLVVAYGSVGRSALWAVREARQCGQQVGLLRLKSLWPFPDEVIRGWDGRCEEFIVPEMNLGQVSLEVQRHTGVPVRQLSQTNGELIDPRRILRYLVEGEW